MNDYNFWADLLFTFQSSPDWIKALWLITPPSFLLGFLSMLIRYRQTQKTPGYGAADGGELLYTVHRDVHGELQIVSHSHILDHSPAMLVIDKQELSPAALPHPGRRS